MCNLLIPQVLLCNIYPMQVVELRQKDGIGRICHCPVSNSSFCRMQWSMVSLWNELVSNSEC